MFDGGGFAKYTLNPPDTSSNRVRRQTTPTLLRSTHNAPGYRKRRQTTPTTPLRSTLSDRLSLRFRTEVDTGLLLHVGGDPNSGEDFSSFRLESGGSVSYHIHLGSGVVERVDTPPGYSVDDAQWHYLEAERVGLDLRVTLDNITISRMLGGSELYLDVGYGQFYVGGVPVGVSGVGPRYNGCLEDVRVDDNVLPTVGSNGFAAITYQGNSTGVRTGCGLRGCRPAPCGPGGNCTERGETGFVCTCSDGRRLSSPCPAPQRVTPFLFIIIAASAIGGLLLLLIATIACESGVPIVVS